MNKPTYITGTTQSQAYRILREHASSVLAKHGLTPTHWAMLGVILEARDGVRQSDIARTLRVKPPLVTNMNKYLEDKGVIQSVPNQFDARAKLLAVTPVGKKFIKLVEAELHELFVKLLHGLTEQDMATYNKVLTTIITNNDKLHGKK